MSESDNSQRRGSSGFRQPGLGMLMSFLCATCDKKAATTGRRLMLVRGVRSWVCAACARSRMS